MDLREHDPGNNQNGKPPQGELHQMAQSGRKSESAAYSGPMATQAGIFDYWRVFVSRKGTLLIAAVLGATVGLVISVPRTPIYQARTTIEIQGLNDNLLNTRDVNPSAPSVS